MGDLLLNLPIPWMAVVIFAATYLIAACVYLLVFRLAVGDRARAFKAFSPGMLPVLGTIFALLVAFVAVQVWNDFDKAKLAVATEASSLRAVVLLGETLPAEQRMHLRTLINSHIEEAEPRMASDGASAPDARILGYPPSGSPTTDRLNEAPRRVSTHGPEGDRGCVA